MDIKLLSSLLGCFFLSVGLFAQPLSREEALKAAESNIKALRDGVLVVRLESEAKKVAALEKMLDQEDLSASQKSRAKEQIEETIKQRDAINKGLVEGFREHYDFSEVYFVYDTSFAAVVGGLSSGFFLNDSLEIQPSIELPGGTFFTARFGNSDAASTTRLEDSLILMDAKGDDLQDPFPYYSWIFTPKQLFKYNLLNNKDKYRLHMIDLVKKLDKRLQKYYEGVE